MRYVAFLRAINVGGRVVKMEHLRTLCESIPLAGVSTFIASGNILFESNKSRAQIESSIEKKLETSLGYPVATMVRSGPDLAAVVERVSANKLDAGVQLYVGFLKTKPSAQTVKALAAMSNAIDTLEIDGIEVYWRCKKGWSESSVAGPKLERTLGQPVTFRNVNTVRKLAARLA